MFDSLVLEHFRQPRNVGVVKDCSHSYLEKDNPWLIRILFTLQVQGETIREVRFHSKSCVTTIACASALTEIVKGRSVGFARTVSADDLSRSLGGIPPEKMYCCDLVIAALRTALQSPAAKSKDNSQE